MTNYTLSINLEMFGEGDLSYVRPFISLSQCEID
jgi:hypothetical protein